MSLQLADQQRDDPAALERLLAGALDNARAGIADLRELAAGMHPSILTNRGLRAAARSLGDRSAVPVTVTAPRSGLLPLVEVAAYFVIAEALTNIDKHLLLPRRTSAWRGTRTWYDHHRQRRCRRCGASTQVVGLLGLRDRVEALGGTLVVRRGARQDTTWWPRFAPGVIRIRGRARGRSPPARSSPRTRPRPSGRARHRVRHPPRPR